MKSAIALSAAALAMLTLTGCPGASVHTDYDHHVNFSQFKTFSFAHVQTDNPLYEQRIKDEVTKDLQSKGLSLAPSGGDLEVTAVGAAHTEKEYQTFYNNPGFGYFYGGFGGIQATTVRHYRVGTLVMDMYNGQNKNLVWRGTVSRGVSGSADENTGKLDDAIDVMLKNFPSS